jgi:hypothetical protein
MSSHKDTTHLPPKLDLSGWSRLPSVLMVGGGILSVVGALISFKHDGGSAFGFSWLFAFIFYLTIALGALFLVIVHHLTDAGWSVPIRRFCEHLASLLFPWLAILFLPVILFAPKIFTWLTLPAADELIRARAPVFTLAGFVAVSAAFFGVWWLLSSRLRYWSLRQDVTGDALCVQKMRFHSGWGILAFAATITGASVLWVKSLQYQWFSAMYGVYFFSDCTWIALATVYVITVILQRQRVLDEVLHDSQFYFLGVCFFAFTIFSAYTEFAQYFVVWNANMPTETFYYLIRERGTWWWVSMILIVGHFFVPFFLLLPVKAKSNFKIVLPVCALAWLMHALDLSFNILPAARPDGYPLRWIPLQLGCLAFMGGFLAWVFLKKFASHAPYPQRDPRVLEAMGIGLEPEEYPDTLPANGGDQ